MKIEHIAIWVKDIDRVCEFYRKYFGGVVQPLYHNPTKQFTSRFISFDDGARLEVMHRPDICIEQNVGTVTSLQSDTHRSANEKMRAFFRFLTSAVFHVKQLQTEEAAGNSFTDISEVQQVGSEGAEARYPTSWLHPSFLFRRFKRRGGPSDPANVFRRDSCRRSTKNYR